MSREELLGFCRWLCKDEFSEGHEEEIVDKYLAEQSASKIQERLSIWDGVERVIEAASNDPECFKCGEPITELSEVRNPR